MHERQYRDYKSGVAKERFNKDLAEMKAKAGAPIEVVRPVVEMPKFDVEEYTKRYPHAVPVQAPAKGSLVWQVDVDDDSALAAGFGISSVPTVLILKNGKVVDHSLGFRPGPAMKAWIEGNL